MRRKVGILRNDRSHERGASLVEFAIMAPLLILLLLGIVEFGWGIAQQLDTRHVAREAGRLAQVDSPAATVSALCAADLADIDSITRTGSSAASQTATVTVVADLRQITGFFGGLFGPTPTITSAVSIRLEQDALLWNGSNPC